MQKPFRIWCWVHAETGLSEQSAGSGAEKIINQSCGSND